jgi:SAM-dependent methyltransferase
MNQLLLNFTPHHGIQRLFAISAPYPLANLACKEDPAELGELVGATNLDLEEMDQYTKVTFREGVKNFVQGSILDLPFDDNSYASAVVGELMEHCRPEPAEQALRETKRVVRPGGPILLTFPLDDRPKMEQHGPEGPYYEHCEGITSWHQTVWSDIKMNQLLDKVGLELTGGLTMPYPGCEGRALFLRVPQVPGE